MKDEELRIKKCRNLLNSSFFIPNSSFFIGIVNDPVTTDPKGEALDNRAIRRLLSQQVRSCVERSLTLISPNLIPTGLAESC